MKCPRGHVAWHARLKPQGEAIKCPTCRSTWLLNGDG